MIQDLHVANRPPACFDMAVLDPKSENVGW